MMRHGGSRLRTFGGVLLLLAGGLELGACGLLRPDVKNPFDGDRGMRWIRIEVQNHNWSDATLHALRGAERHRLGVVIGKTDARYVMEWPTSMQLRIEIDLLAAESCVTRPLIVDPGDHIELQIASELSLDPDCEPFR